VTREQAGTGETSVQSQIPRISKDPMNDAFVLVGGGQQDKDTANKLQQSDRGGSGQMRVARLQRHVAWWCSAVWTVGTHPRSAADLRGPQGIVGSLAWIRADEQFGAAAGSLEDNKFLQRRLGQLKAQRIVLGH